MINPLPTATYLACLQSSDLPEKRITPRNVIKYEIKPNFIPANSVQRVAEEELSIGIYIPSSIVIISFSVSTQRLRDNTISYPQLPRH